MVRITVVGAGYLGSSVAFELARTGHDVLVVAREHPPRTTSDVAAAIWYPYLAEPRDRVRAWAASSLARYVELAERHPDSGVTRIDGHELFPIGHEPPHAAWLRALLGDDAREPDAADRARFGPEVDALRLRVPIAESPTYLPWLRRQIEAAGGRFATATVDDLAARATADRADVVVNCTGLGARELADDPSVEPIRGLVVRVAAPTDGPRVEPRFVIDDRVDGRPVYVVPRPRAGEWVLGGTAERGETDLAPAAARFAAVRTHAVAAVPSLDSAPIVATVAGLRPGRPTVRLEVEPAPLGTGAPIVHCYGHGGAGMTLAWGCAAEVAAHVAALERGDLPGDAARAHPG